jgi:rare lipoprotein A (peptidoglycan hydrolase)
MPLGIWWRRGAVFLGFCSSLAALAPASCAAPVVDERPWDEGLTSFYSDALADRKTASGEPYRPELATCAHRTYAFGQQLEVVVVDSGAKSACRVNDRGPYVEGRILDVSKSVAEALGIVDAGVVRVRIRPLTK